MKPVFIATLLMCLTSVTSLSFAEQKKHNESEQSNKAKQSRQLDKPEVVKTHTEFFMGLFNNHCWQKATAKAAYESVKSHGGFSPSKDYDDVYEIDFKGSNYAVTPDQDFCSVDVMLVSKTDKLILSREQIIQAVIAKTGYEQIASTYSLSYGITEKMSM